MNIIFKTVKTKNFMSFKKLEFDFSQFQGQNVLIYGVNDDIKGDSTRSNGSGKSTIMNTLLFSLYGDILNSVKKMAHIKNWTCGPKEDVEVSLTLQSNGVDYAIQRLLRGKKGDQELHVFRKNAETDEWEEITLSTIAETQRMIENDIVLCGKDGFLRCVLLTADQNYNFFKLNKTAKNQFFESLFELTVYSDMYNRLHRKTLDENASLTASSRTIDSLNSNILKLEQDRENEKNNRESMKKAMAALNKAKSELENFESKIDVDSEINEIDRKISLGKTLVEKELSEAMDRYDMEHGPYKLGANGEIVFDKNDESSALSKAFDDFDKKHGINVDKDGNIDFGENDEYEQMVSKGTELKGRISNGKDLCKKINDEIIEIENKSRTLQGEITCGEQRIKSMKMTLGAHSKITDILCEDCLGKYKRSVKIEDFDEEIEKIEKNNEKLKISIGECDENILNKKAVLEKYQAGIEKLEQSLSSLREKVGEIISYRKTLQSERELCGRNAVSEIRLKHREIQNDRNEFRTSEKYRLNEKNSLVEKELLNKRNSILNTYESLKKVVENAKYQYDILGESVSKSFDAPINTLKETLESTKCEFYEHTCNVAHYKALEEILKPENIRKSVVSDMLKELNFRICGYLSKMGSNYTCNFDDDFDATFISSAGNETEYNNFSSGEKMRLGIACCLAFRDFMQVRLNLHPNILAIDEYIDSNLDPMAVNGIMDMIHYMVGTEKIAAFIISHRSEVMQDMFDSEIMVHKKNNESEIIVNGFS